MGMGTNVLNSDEMRVVVGGVKLLKKAHEDMGTLTPELKRTIEGLEFILFGGTVAVTYHDGGYG